MSVWFVSRHPGAIEWAARSGLAVDRRVTHLDPAAVEASDTVIGTLPMSAAAEVCRRGARFLALDMRLPESMRGRELSSEELAGLECTLTEYRVIAVPA